MKNLLLPPLFLLFSLPASALTGGPDIFGYTWTDSNDASASAPDYEWIEPKLDTQVVPPGGVPSALVDLQPTVVFYGVELDQIMVSRYGYVTFDPTDNGLDSTNDCPFPAVPDFDSAGRIAVMHDALGPIGNINTAGIFHQYYPESPHPHHRCGVHVITWKDVAHDLSSDTFSFQLLLFDNFDMIMQYGPNPENGSGSSTGLQSGVPNGGSIFGLKVACNFAGSIPDNYAILFEPPTVVVDSDSDAASQAGGLSLREAVLTSQAGTKIVFDASLDGATILRDGALDQIGYLEEKVLSVDATSLPNGISISGGGEEPIWYAESRVHFSNITFREAWAPGHTNEGALTTKLCVNGCTPVVATVSECQFISNEGGEGGAINANIGSRLFVSNCDFLLNTASEFGGGAIDVDRDSILSVYRCDFLFNDSSHSGGAINIASGSLVIVESSFHANSASEAGGAVDMLSMEAVEIRGCLFAGNSALNGGALQSGNTDFEITDSTFSGNDASSSGSVIDQFGIDGVVVVRRCTVVDNVGSAFDSSGGTFEVESSIFADSAASGVFFTGFGSYVSLGHNLADAPSSVLDHASDIVDTDPLLGPLASNGGPTSTHALPVDSPAIDANPSVHLGGDQRGYSRYVGSGMDIGAYEFQGDLVVTTATDEMVTPGTGLSLREAIRDAGPGTVITFDPSLNGDTISLSSFFSGQGESLVITKDLSVDASALAGGITLDGFDAMRVLRVERASVSLVNVDIENGSLAAGDPFGGGAGMIVTGGADVSFSDGAVRLCSSGNPGGGVAVTFGSTLSMSDSTVAGNSTTADGGGIHAGGSLTLQRMTIGNNTATGGGGGIATVGGSTAIYSRCTIARNTADSIGGGIYLSETPGSLVNMTVSGNVSGTSGGGIYASNSEVAIEHCTIADNRATNTAGGIVTASSQGGGRPTLGHCIVAANQVDDSELLNLRAFNQEAEPASAGYNLIDDDSFSNAGVTDLEERVAYLAPLANYGSDLQTHALLAISPAIDAGDVGGEGTPSTDQRGYARIADGRSVGGGRIDIGAHEAAEPVFVGDLLDVVDGVGQRSLRGAIDQAAAGGRVVFRQTLNGGVIDLSTAAGGQGTQLLVNRSIQIDATSLSDGITISGGDESRVFDVTGGADVAMHALRIEDGFTGAGADGGGFRIGGNADLLLTHSSVSGNRGRDGGAFHISGGASARLQNVTVSGNTAQREGAAAMLVGAAASMTLEHCSVVDQRLAGAGTVGGFSMGAGKLTLYSTVLADIPGASLSSDDFSNFTTHGYNLSEQSSALIDSLLIAPGDQTGVDPVVSGLQDDGGWSKVHRFQPTSALYNAGDPEPSLLPALSANAGVRLIGRMDIGAKEFNGRSTDSDSDGMPDYWENLWGFDIADSADAGENPDLDGATNVVEFQNGTNPLRTDVGALAPPEVIAVDLLGETTIQYVVKTEPGISYIFETSEDLQQWAPPVSFTGASGSSEMLLQLPVVHDRQFIRFSLAPLE